MLFELPLSPTHSWWPCRTPPTTQTYAFLFGTLFRLTPGQSWLLESYIAPSGLTLWVVLAVLVAMAANVLTILFLRWREVCLPFFALVGFVSSDVVMQSVEDDREARASAAHVSFHAMG
jgi:hypothetical protein